MVTVEGVDPRMIANNLMPFEPVHPGEFIKEEIESRGISQRKFAVQMGVAYSVFNEILNGKRPVTAEYALLIEAVLGIDAGLFIRMQADYNMQVVRRDKTFSKRLAKIRKVAAAAL
jgi:addiction module HigA family antidote